MAIYHLSAQIISRADGRSAVAASAYRSGEKMEDRYTGETADYTGKGNVVYSTVILPENAPEEYKDRETLWNSVEAAEGAKNAQLAREINVALPTEIPQEEQIRLAEDYVRESFVSQGMCADLAVHNPPRCDDHHRPVMGYKTDDGYLLVTKSGDAQYEYIRYDEQYTRQEVGTLDDFSGDQKAAAAEAARQSGVPITEDLQEQICRGPNEKIYDNPHFHVMLTMRPIDEDGKWAAKSSLEYVCKKDGKEQGFTAEEFKKAKEEGWEKEYKYRDASGKESWRTPSESQDGYTRVRKQPRSNHVDNETVAKWNDRGNVEAWRVAWENAANKALEQHGSEQRIDHRSNAGRGIDERPMVHCGPDASSIDKRAEREIREGKAEDEVNRSIPGQINRDIMEERKLTRKLRSMVSSIEKAAKDISEKAKAAAELAAEKAKAAISETAERLERIRGRVVKSEYYSLKGQSIEWRGKEKDSSLEEAYRAVQETARFVDSRNREISELKRERAELSGIQFMRKRQLTDEIEDKQSDIKRQLSWQKQVISDYGFKDPDEVRIAYTGYKKEQESRRSVKDHLDIIARAENTDISTYRTINETVSDDDRQKVADQRKSIRPSIEAETKVEVQREEGRKFISSTYDRAVESADKKLQGDQGGRTQNEKESGIDKLRTRHEKSILKHQKEEKSIGRQGHIR